MSDRPTLLGYWFAHGPPALLSLPRPQRLVDPAWPARDAVLGYLRAGDRYEQYGGSSWCRFRCGIADRDMGSRELTDGEWVWPAGLAHYVEVHHVVLPDAFVARVAGGRPPSKRGGFDDVAPWRAWAQARGGCLAVDPGWQPIADERWQSRQLGKQARAAHLDGHHVLVSGHGGGLELLRDGVVVDATAFDDEAGHDRLVGPRSPE